MAEQRAKLLPLEQERQRSAAVAEAEQLQAMRRRMHTIREEVEAARKANKRLEEDLAHQVYNRNSCSLRTYGTNEHRMKSWTQKLS